MRRGGADRAGDDLGGPPPAGSAVRSAITRFTLSGVLAALIVTGVTLVICDRIAESVAVEEARDRAVGVVDRLLAPLVNEDVRAGRPGAADELSLVMDNRMGDGSVRHVRVWDKTGRVIWADEPELVGQRFDLSAEVAALLGSRTAEAELSDVLTEETVTAQTGNLIEVHVGTFDSDGRPLVAEVFMPAQRVEQVERALVAAFVPPIVGAIFLLLLLMLPLAVALGRRVERGQAERVVLTRHALLASELERRRIAEDLHNGLVQELAGLGYSLSAATEELDEGGDMTLARSLLHRGTDLLQRSIETLRGRMTDIYPPDLRGPGLRDAVRRLAAVEARRGHLEARVEIPEALELSPDAGSLAYRVVREGLRNVVQHSGAHVVVVELSTDGSHVDVRIADDGRGPGDRPGESPRDHFGLRLLSDTVRDFGGRLDVREREEGGTLLSARFPSRPAVA